MIGILGKLGKPFLSVTKKISSYFKTSLSEQFITSDGHTFKT
jgi:hypothetical protein